MKNATFPQIDIQKIANMIMFLIFIYSLNFEESISKSTYSINISFSPFYSIIKLYIINSPTLTGIISIPRTESNSNENINNPITTLLVKEDNNSFYKEFLYKHDRNYL